MVSQSYTARSAFTRDITMNNSKQSPACSNTVLSDSLLAMVSNAAEKVSILRAVDPPLPECDSLRVMAELFARVSRACTHSADVEDSRIVEQVRDKVADVVAMARVKESSVEVAQARQLLGIETPKHVTLGLQAFQSSFPQGTTEQRMADVLRQLGLNMVAGRKGDNGLRFTAPLDPSAKK